MHTKTARPDHRPDPGADTAFVDMLDTNACKQRFAADDEFLFLDEFLPADTVARFQARIPALTETVHRNFIPKHKKGGSVSRYSLDVVLAQPLHFRGMGRTHGSN